MLKEGLKHYFRLLPFWYFPRWIQPCATEEMRLTKHAEIKCLLRGNSKALFLYPEISKAKTTTALDFA